MATAYILLELGNEQHVRVNLVSLLGTLDRVASILSQMLAGKHQSKSLKNIRNYGNGLSANMATENIAGYSS